VETTQKPTPMSWWRRYLLSGFLVWIPIVITFVVVKFLVDLLDRSLILLPPEYRPEELLGVNIPGLGVILCFVVVLLTGMLVANFVGRWLVHISESVLNHIPLVRSVYAGVKKVTETMVTPQGQSFRRVLLVEYPRADCWTIAFQTQEAFDGIKKCTGIDDLISIYVPTTPNPTSGFWLMVSASRVKELSISVDEALKLILSLGVVMPDEKKPRSLH